MSGGSIRWQDRELVGLSETELIALRGREIALISQEPMVALDPMFSVAYQLTQPIRRFRKVGRGEARRIAAELLQQVGIVDAQRVLKSYPHQLSGGMAQRVCIALALTGQPKLLIADEPTTALDVTVQAEILSLLRALVRDTGLSVVIVSHDLGVVADICDDVRVMYAGQVVEDGTTAAVLDDPAHPYTMALLGANPHVARGRAGAAAAGLDPRHRAAARFLADGLPVRHPLPVRPGEVHDAVPGAARARRRLEVARCCASARTRSTTPASPGAPSPWAPRSPPTPDWSPSPSPTSRPTSPPRLPE